MIRVVLTLDSRNLLRKAAFSGHAGQGKKGEDIVCASVTALIRTASRSFQLDTSVEVESDAPSPGELRVKVNYIPPEREVWALGITDFLRLGLQDMEREFPGSLSVEIAAAEP